MWGGAQRCSSVAADCVGQIGTDDGPVRVSRLAVLFFACACVGADWPATQCCRSKLLSDSKNASNGERGCETPVR